MIGSYLGTQAGNIVNEGITNFTKKILPGLKEIDDIEKKTIYLEGQKTLKTRLEH